MSARTSEARRPWCAAAEALGFEAVAESGARARGDLSLRSEGDWLALVEEPAAAPPESGTAAGELGTPGPWRRMRLSEGWTRVVDLPLTSLSQVGPDGSAAEAPWPALLEWALAMRDGAPPANWRPPAREEVESWVPSERLKLRCGAHLLRGELVHAPERLALVFPELARLPADLSDARRSWVDELLACARSHWRLVRLGVEPGTGRVRAEVDLTGVPDVWARPLVQLSIEALAWAVDWTLVPLTFLADPRSQSRALERPHTHRQE